MVEKFMPTTFTIGETARQIITSTSVKKNISEARALDRIIKDWAMKQVEEDLKRLRREE